jgi:hypothetical protein
MTEITARSDRVRWFDYGLSPVHRWLALLRAASCGKNPPDFESVVPVGRAMAGGFGPISETYVPDRPGQGQAIGLRVLECS